MDNDDHRDLITSSRISLIKADMLDETDVVISYIKS